MKSCREKSLWTKEYGIWLAKDSLRKNIVVDYYMMIDKRTGEVLGLEVDFTCYKEKYRPQNHRL